jgi:hypothetical protein
MLVKPLPFTDLDVELIQEGLAASEGMACKRGKKTNMVYSRQRMGITTLIEYQMNQTHTRCAIRPRDASFALSAAISPFGFPIGSDTFASVSNEPIRIA